MSLNLLWRVPRWSDSCTEGTLTSPSMHGDSLMAPQQPRKPTIIIRAPAAIRMYTPTERSDTWGERLWGDRSRCRFIYPVPCLLADHRVYSQNISLHLLKEEITYKHQAFQWEKCDSGFASFEGLVLCGLQRQVLWWDLRRPRQPSI